MYKWVPLVCANVLSAAIGSVLLLIGFYKENIPLLFLCSFIFGHQVKKEIVFREFIVVGRRRSSVNAVLCNVSF